MERINAKFQADNLDQRDGDMIYRIHYKEGEGEMYLYLLMELQSSHDKWMALRTLVYVGMLYQQLIKEGRLDDTQSWLLATSRFSIQHSSVSKTGTLPNASKLSPSALIMLK